MVGVGHALQALLEAGTVAVDGGGGYVVANPNPAMMAVLELTKYTCEAVQRAGIWVEVCGEAAGDPALIPKLVELGLGELSMSALSIPRAKKVISEL